MIRLEIWKGERKIATLPKYSWTRPCYKSAPGAPENWVVWPGIKTIGLYHFNKLTLEPPVLFEHLSGVGLSGFLDHCEFRRFEEGQTRVAEDLRYVHGRSEVMKGTPLVSAVVLAQIEKADDYNELQFMAQLPAIYREFLRTVTSSTEKPEGT